MDHGIVRVDPANKKHVNAISHLHEQLLPTSLPVRFGPVFMKQFYFSQMISSGWLVCDLYFWNDQPAGFCVYTKHPYGFIKKGVKQHAIRVALILLLSLIFSPSKLKIYLYYLKNEKNIPSDKKYNNTGQLVTIGVLKDFRKYVDEKSGQKISQALYQSMTDYFKNECFNTILSAVKKRNETAIAFYKQRGFEFSTDEKVEKDSYLITRYLTR